MPVTVPLPFGRRGATRSRRYRVATRAVAVSAVVSASLGVLAATEQHRTETPPAGQPLAATSAASTTESATNDPTDSGTNDPTDSGTNDPTESATNDPTESATNNATEFTPEAQIPQVVPETVLWEQQQMAIEAARPRTVRPVTGMLTSNFGTRWGALHAGLDFGDPIGAPIATVTDGTIIEAGPASGFGLWVRVQQDDGSVGVYGHVNDILATVGQEVRAGDIIATVGNRGYSTGPHLHYEVHEPGVGPVDPRPWLAARGVEITGDPD
ncbi:M23 family metallopeptidase [Nocardia australiensis]|uniref:M23 family metallopeptidase n=1 Tax=Nocardia australiensis TaxID=2887191 RepID=UPI001D15BEB5|nr:M23 family metallopeptidase [Nocardia australiensis]